MNHSMINSMVSMNALQQKLDMIANNIANVNTAGYKRKEATFQDVLTSIAQQPSAFKQEGRLSPLGFNEGWGSRISQIQMNMRQGTMQQTDNPLDLAIEGDAFFEIGINEFDDNGNPVVMPAWTRNGSFRLSIQPGDPDNAYLSTDQGYLVRGGGDEPIRIPNGYQVSVDAQGMVSAHAPGQEETEAIPIGRVKLVRILRPELLESLGQQMFALPANAGNADEWIQPVGLDVNDPMNSAVRQGFLEQSNVTLADEMAELMTVQRAYQLSSRALVSGDTMLNLANNLRG